MGPIRSCADIRTMDADSVRPINLDDFKDALRGVREDTETTEDAEFGNIIFVVTHRYAPASRQGISHFTKSGMTSSEALLSRATRLLKVKDTEHFTTGLMSCVGVRAYVTTMLKEIDVFAG